MYRSVVDASPQELAFAFDPLRPLHAHDGSSLAWPEYPYKQAVIDKLCNKRTKPQLSQAAAAGALLLGRGDFSRALFEVDQHFDHDHASNEENEGGNSGWHSLEKRFHIERDAFFHAKKEFLKNERLKVANKLDGIAQRKKDEQDRVDHEAWRRRQIIKRYENGAKYDGEGINENGVLIPHGHGTLWVPQDESVAGGDVKRVPRYVGEWTNGCMHGRGTYFWRNGDAWKGNFCRDELHGKGIFTRGNGDVAEDSDADTSRVLTPTEQQVRYYDASQHICWGHELVCGCRLRLYENRLYGEPLVSVMRRHNVALEHESECVILSYDEARDQYLLRTGETEQTKWVSLANTNFRVVVSRPIARLEPGDN